MDDQTPTPLLKMPDLRRGKKGKQLTANLLPFCRQTGGDQYHHKEQKRGYRIGKAARQADWPFHFVLPDWLATAACGKKRRPHRPPPEPLFESGYGASSEYQPPVSRATPATNPTKKATKPFSASYHPKGQLKKNAARFLGLRKNGCREDLGGGEKTPFPDNLSGN